jgi:hypothetical protein
MMMTPVEPTMLSVTLKAAGDRAIREQTLPLTQSYKGRCPAAIRKAVARILVRPARGLYDSIKGDVFKYGNFSHVFGFQFIIIFTWRTTPSEIS